MRSKFTLFFIFFSFATSICQPNSNPFDIEGRPSLNISPTDSLRISSVFDRVPIQEINENSNPFDVSHIPLEKKEIRKNKKKTYSNTDSHLFDFRFYVLLGLLLVFALMMAVFRKEVFSLIKPLLNSNFLELMNRDTNNGRTDFFALSYLFFAANAAFLLYHILTNWMEKGWSLMLWVFIACIGIYSIKYFVLGLLGYTFPIQKPLSNYSFMVTLHNSIAGILLFPLNVLLFLSPAQISNWIIWFAVFVLIFLYLFRILRGSFMRRKSSDSKILHFFLYLCASEIAPIALVYGFINQNGGSIF